MEEEGGGGDLSWQFTQMAIFGIKIFNNSFWTLKLKRLRVVMAFKIKMSHCPTLTLCRFKRSPLGICCKCDIRIVMWYAMKFVQRCPGHCWSVNEAIYSNMANSYRAKHKLFVRVVYILLVYRAIIISGAVPDTALGNERNFRRRGQTF